MQGLGGGRDIFCITTHNDIYLHRTKLYNRPGQARSAENALREDRSALESDMLLMHGRS